MIKTDAIKSTSVTLTNRQICDLELILNGAFKPLKTFLNKKDYDCVLDNMRLSSDELWPIPITLDLSEKFIKDSGMVLSKEAPWKS